MMQKIKLYEGISVTDLGVELQRLVPGLDDESAHAFAKSILAAATKNQGNRGIGAQTVIGAQTWMKENLAVDDGGEGIYFNEENGEHYYTWEAAVRIAKSIPGWHLPTDEEWVVAAKACGATPGSDGDGDYTGVEKLKSKLNISLTGFVSYGSFYGLGGSAYFWTATEKSSAVAYYRNFNRSTSMGAYSYNKTGYAFSVRLVKD